jgi:hypothetical protein
MQILIKSTEKSRFMAKLEWHPWYAWYPVLVNVGEDYSKRYAFMETVARIGYSWKPSTMYVTSWEYKSLEEAKTCLD